MRREPTIAAGQPPAVASIIFGQMMRCAIGCSVFCSDVASGLPGTTRTQYESVAAIRDLRSDAKVRGAISALAEHTKTNLLGLMRQRDDWKTPVVVNLQSQQSNLP
jgi:hypothetical protein